jgi:hypothetical protein
MDALLAAFGSHDYAKIRKLFSGEPAPKGPAPKEPKKEPRVRDPEGKDRRAWMREHGFPDIKERGNLPKEAIAAYEAAHKTT